MILFLRDDNNDSVLDLEVYATKGHIELRSVVAIEPYSKMLMAMEEGKRSEAIREFRNLQELRGWLWESYFMGRQNTSTEYDKVLEILRDLISDVGKKYNLGYVED